MNWFLSKSMMMVYFSIMPIIFLFSMNTKVIVHLDMNSFFMVVFNMTIMIDKLSLLFMSMVSIVSSIVIFYSFLYLKSSENEISMKKFSMILISFIISMIILSFSTNIFWLMIGWDGLGISSFCLIIFYQNWKSFSSGMVTFMSNRLGDVMIIFCITWSCTSLISDSWMLNEFLILPFSALLALGAYSKSAQLPYLYWLPQAMAAPTPVSALVHSSTLVTAGIFMMSRFGPISEESTKNFLFIVSSITVMIAGTSSIMEFDLKKVIALSTLCHISLIIMFSVMGNIENSSTHMIMHAFFKSMLFMVAGYLIHLNINFQDIRWIKMSKIDIKVSHAFFVSTLSMMGFPFMSGFYSKEALLSSSFNELPFMAMSFMFLMNSLFSCAYSSRLAKHIFFSKSMIRLSMFSDDKFKNLFMISSILSSFFAGMFIFLMSEQEMIQSPLMKFILILFSITGVLIGIKSNLIMTISKHINSSLSDLWKSNFIYKILQKNFFLSSKMTMWDLDEKGAIKYFILSCTKTLSSSFILISHISMKEPLFVMKIMNMIILSSMLML